MTAEISTFIKTAQEVIKAVTPMVLAAAGRGGEAATKKRDGSLVTVTDQHVENRLIAALTEQFPASPVLGEEGAIDASEGGAKSAIELYSTFMGEPYQLIIDPIDGTRNFVEGSGEYCIAAALTERVEGGIWPVAAVIGIPRDRALYWCDEYRVYKQDLATGDTRIVSAVVDKAAPASVNSRDRAWLTNEGLKLVRPWVSSGSSIFDFLGTSLGRLCGSVIGSQRLWDLMPALAIANRLGLVLRDLRTGERISCIGPQDLSLDLVTRPWGIARRMLLARPDLEIDSVVVAEDR